MKWTRATVEAITTERQVRVVNEEGQEGYVRLSWENKEHTPRFFGSVYTLERHYDDKGFETKESTKTTIDDNPTFV